MQAIVFAVVLLGLVRAKAKPPTTVLEQIDEIMKPIHERAAALAADPGENLAHDVEEFIRDFSDATMSLTRIEASTSQDKIYIFRAVLANSIELGKIL